MNNRTGFLLLIIVILSSIICTEKSTASDIDSLTRQLAQTSNGRMRAGILIELAKQYSYSDYAPAMKYAEMAVEEATQANADSVLLEALNRAGDIHMRAGLFDEATGYFSRGMEISQKSGQTQDILIACINLGAICMGSKEFTKASAWFIKAMNLANKLKNDQHDSILPVQAISIYNNFSIISRERGNIFGSLKYNDSALALCRNYPTKKRTLTRLLTERGRILLEIKSYDMAESTLLESLRLSQATKDSTQMVLVQVNLGKLLYLKQLPDDAIQVLMNGLQTASMSNDLVSVANITVTLYSIYSKYGPADSALKYLTRYQEDDKKVKVAEASREMLRHELKSQYKSNLSSEAAGFANKIRNSRILMFGISLVTIAILGLLIFFLRKSRKIREEKKSMENIFQRTFEENTLLHDKLEEKDNQLAIKAMAEIKRNEILDEAVDQILDAGNKLSADKPEKIDRIISKLNKSKKANPWEEFDIQFQQTQAGFYSRLHSVCPQLSTNERRLCAFIRMNMSTKDISSITGQSILSIHKSRYRLRKKIGITNKEISIGEFIASI